MSIDERPANAIGRTGVRAARSRERKNQLADIAAGLFLERGYAHVSVADVARAAGVTGPALYRHFPDKQSLLLAAVLRGVEELEECTVSSVHDRSDRADLFRVLSSVAVSRPATAVLWRANSVFLSDEQNHEIAARTKAMLSHWSQGLLGPERAAAPGSRTLSWAIMSVVGSVSVHHTRLSSVRARAQIAEVIERLIRLSPDDAPAQRRRQRAEVTSPTRREQILDAAAQLFMTRGFAHVGIDEIGAAVGISGPSVYNHFDSKRAIVAGIARRSGNRLEADADAIFAAAARPPELLAGLVDSYVQIITETPDLSVGFDNTYVLADADGETTRELLAVQRNYVRRWISLLQECRRRDGQAQLDVGEAALQVHAALSIANDAVRMGRNANRADFPAELAYLMKGALGLIGDGRGDS
ncbi:TetR/AcrR family transcriptional regulator [Gordonia jinhuaensis]|uniref:TetR family transcriptional regulator n=1 Tax=Gordonia jinhuaensis TaxID=1517702 RepID=A0A916T2Z9_9ACTN|nr:TetR/AcrR family transcriptional regulator [Gordonia jinhuaensis]GGB28281.1 TetR family transcriptional regulator [Gordonia jinhuaensis]